jgi:hypothetical protein
MPTVSGVLNIISGVLGIIVCLYIFIVAIFLKNADIDTTVASVDFIELWRTMGDIFLVTGIILVIPCIISIIGGVFAIKHNRWGWALAGSICSAIVSNILGIIALIFIVMSKKEFKR